MVWHRVDAALEISPGEKVHLHVAGREMLICRLGNDYFALASRCTHAAWPLAGESIEGSEIVCSLHGARFDIRDGCPTRGPASKPLATFPIERRDGALYVRLSS